MATSNFFAPPGLPASPKYGSANPHLQKSDQMYAAALQQLGNTPQAMALSQQYQDASSGEQANAEAMNNLKGGWGEGAARLAAALIYHNTKVGAAQGINSAVAAQQAGIRSTDDAALGLRSHPGADHAVTSPNGGSVPAMLSTGSTANAMGGQDTPPAGANDNDHAALAQALLLGSAPAGPAQTGADLSAKFAQPPGPHDQLAQALKASFSGNPPASTASPDDMALANLLQGYAGGSATPASGSSASTSYPDLATALANSDPSAQQRDAQIFNRAVGHVPGSHFTDPSSIGAGQAGGMSGANAGSMQMASAPPLALPAPSPSGQGQPSAPADPFGAGGAISQAPPAQPGSFNPSDPHAHAFSFLTAQGLSPAAAAGMVGGFDAESQMNPGAFNPKENAVGIGQWRGPRLAALQSFARAQGSSPQDLNTQLSFAVHELGGSESHAAGLLRTASNPVAGAAAMNSYLRPQGYVPGGDPRAVSNWNGRSGAAMHAMSLYGGQGQDGLQSGAQPAAAPMSGGQGGAPMPAPGGPMQPPPPADPFGGGQPQPQAPQPSQATPTNYNAATPAQLALYQRWANSPYPQERQAAHELAEKLQEQQAAAPAWEPHVDQTTGRILYVDKNNPGAAPVQVAAPPGFVGPAPTNMDYNSQTGGYVPKQGTAESAPRQLSPSAFATQDPFGRYTVTNVPGRAGEAPAGTVWDQGSQSYVPQRGAQTTVSGNWQPGTVTATKPGGEQSVLQGPAYTFADLRAQREAIYNSKDYELHAKTINAVNSLQDMLAQAPGNSGLLSMSAFDNLLQAQTGLSARPGAMQLQLSHLGFPAEVAGQVSNLIGHGPVPPEIVGQAVGILRSYATTHEATLQARVDSENKIAKRYGYDLGVDIPHMNAMPDVPWLKAAPPPPAAPAQPASVNPMRHGDGGSRAAVANGGQPMSPQQAAQLPPGTPFVGLDGHQRMKR